MTIDLYMVPQSPPCRSPFLLARRIGLQVNPILVDLRKGEHKEPKFMAINPEHTVPTIVDHETGLTLWDSHAIMCYLVDKYAPGNPVYPQDVVARARVHRWLYFDCGSLVPAMAGIVRPLIFQNKQPSDEALQALDDKLSMMNTLLAKEGSKFAAGDDLTIADLALCVTLDMPVFLISLDISKHKNVHDWYNRVKEEASGYEEICASVMQAFRGKLDERNA